MADRLSSTVSRLPLPNQELIVPRRDIIDSKVHLYNPKYVGLKEDYFCNDATVALTAPEVVLRRCSQPVYQRHDLPLDTMCISIRDIVIILNSRSSPDQFKCGASVHPSVVVAQNLLTMMTRGLLILSCDREWIALQAVPTPISSPNEDEGTVVPRTRSVECILTESNATSSMPSAYLGKTENHFDQPGLKSYVESKADKIAKLFSSTKTITGLQSFQQPVDSNSPLAVRVDPESSGVTGPCQNLSLQISIAKESLKRQTVCTNISDDKNRSLPFGDKYSALSLVTNQAPYQTQITPTHREKHKDCRLKAGKRSDVFSVLMPMQRTASEVLGMTQIVAEPLLTSVSAPQLQLEVTPSAAPNPKKSKSRQSRTEKEAKQFSSSRMQRRTNVFTATVDGASNLKSFQQAPGSNLTLAVSADPSPHESMGATGSSGPGKIHALKKRELGMSSLTGDGSTSDDDNRPEPFPVEYQEAQPTPLVDDKLPDDGIRPDGARVGPVGIPGVLWDDHIPMEMPPAEESDRGNQSEMCLSREASLPTLLKSKETAPMFCLPKRSVRWKSFILEDTFATTRSSVNTSQSGEDGHPAPGPPETEPPEIDYEEITKLLRIPDYHSIIQLGGVRSQHLSPKSGISAHFITGVAYFKLSKYDKATEEFQESQSLAKSLKRDGDVMLCSAYLGDIQYASQKYLKAAEHYKTAIKHYALTSVAFYFKLTPPTLSAIHAKRASSFRNVSRMVEAVQDYRTAISVAHTDRDRLSAHTSLGNLYQSMGENSKALEEYKESIKLATHLSDHVSLGWAHGNIGNAYLGLNRKDEALFNLHKSLDLATEYERTPQAIGRTYNNLGTAYQSTNDLDKAEEYYDLALSQAIFGNDKAGQARVYGNIGNVHMLRKNYERAIPHYGEVLQLSKDPATVSTARHNRGCAYYEWATSLLGKVPMEVHYHGPKCDVDVCLSHLPAKAKELYRKGSEDLEEVMKYHEEKFQHIKGSTQGLTLSVSLFESNSRTFHRLQDCLVNLHKSERALEVAEKSRARTLGELMLKRKSKDLKQQLNSPLDFEQIASIVKSQRNPLVYLSYTGARLIGWVFTLCSDEVSMNVFEIPLADDQFDDKSFDYYLRYTLTEKLVERSFEMYRTIQYDEVSSSPVQMLFELLAAPIQKLLSSNGSNQQVIFISDSYTSLLPLACLHDKNSGSFFGDRHCFKLAPSLLTLGIMNQLPEVIVTLPPDQQDVCVIGDPNIPPFTLNGEVWTLGKLPYARREAEWVAFALQTTPILNENATLTSFLTRSMSAKVIHIATHGSASYGFLAFATFATSAKSGSRVYVPAENVLLYPDKVEQLHISPALVVLSSCDSARGTVKADGIQGMARAFILAGAQSVLTTLWKVPDESASVFMQFFYQYLLDGLKSSFALQKATLSVRCFAKYSQYIHWSGYQLTGRDIHFSTAATEVEKIFLRDRLGTPSVFPRLQSIKMLEIVLVKNTALPTDIQVCIIRI